MLRPSTGRDRYTDNYSGTINDGTTYDGTGDHGSTTYDNGRTHYYGDGCPDDHGRFDLDPSTVNVVNVSASDIDNLRRLYNLDVHNVHIDVDDPLAST